MPVLGNPEMLLGIEHARVAREVVAECQISALLNVRASVRCAVLEIRKRLENGELALSERAPAYLREIRKVVFRQVGKFIDAVAAVTNRLEWPGPEQGSHVGSRKASSTGI